MGGDGLVPTRSRNADAQADRGVEAAPAVAGEGGLALAQPPLLSVVMPVRNAMPHLPLAIESILAQRFGGFEFVIGDDASDDGSSACIRDYARRDPRIRLLHPSQARRGPVGSSNWVAGAARGEFVARMDADDLARPGRLQRQLEVLRAHPAAVLVGTLFDAIDDDGRSVRRRDRSALRRAPVLPVAHGSIMYRRDAFEAVGGYRGGCDYFEDDDLYRRLQQCGDLLVLPEPLYVYRFSGRGSRLCDDSVEVELRLDRKLAHRTRLHAGDAAPTGSSAPAPRVSPATLMQLGALRLWAGERPRLLPRLWGRMRWSSWLELPGPLLFALATTLSPAATRGLLRRRAAWRDRRAARDFPDGHVYRWSASGGAIDLGALAAAPEAWPLPDELRP